MKYAHILSSFYFEPWNIIPAKHVAMGQVLQQHLQKGNLPEPRAMRICNDGPVVGPVWDDDSTPVVPQMQVGHGVAIIPVFGILGRHLSFLSLFCGGCDYEHVCEMTEIADADPSIQTILYNFNSPGGQHIGMIESMQKIGKVGKKKVAYFDKCCGSAAFGLAAVCDEIYCAPTAQAGCIGSYMACMDTSREWEMLGWRLELFRSGKYKAAGEEGKEWTDDERAWFQQQTEYAAKQFKDAIATKRTIAPEHMEGQTFFGQQAAEIGLADGVVNDLQDIVDASVAAAAYQLLPDLPDDGPED